MTTVKLPPGPTSPGVVQLIHALKVRKIEVIDDTRQHFIVHLKLERVALQPRWMRL